MTVFAALLRGINVGGHHKVPMADLRSIFEAHGAFEVSTYIQSGNVVFVSDAPEAELATELSGAIEERFGFAVPLVLRDASELASAGREHPLAHLGAEEKLQHVAFLATAPSKAAVSAADFTSYAPDAVVVRGRDVYIAYPNGSGRSKLTLDVIERQLGGPATARNWLTVQKLVAMTEALGA